MSKIDQIARQPPHRQEPRLNDGAGPQARNGPVGDDLNMVRGASGRSRADFERAYRHTGRVRLMRLMLPIIGAVTILIIIGSLFLTSFEIPDVRFGSTRIEAGKLVMDNPSLSGMDDNERPYSLKADHAVQDTDTPHRIALEGIVAELPMDDTATARVNANSGLYDADMKTLWLGGGVAVDTDTGLKLRLQDADIDIDKGKMVTGKPVELDTGTARITANSLMVENGGKTIIFSERVRMLIRPGKGDGVSSGDRDTNPGTNTVAVE